jgi:hypothetical protein
MVLYLIATDLPQGGEQMLRIRIETRVHKAKQARILLAEITTSKVNTVVFRYTGGRKGQPGFFHLPDNKGELHCFYTGRSYATDLWRQPGREPIKRFGRLAPKGLLYIRGNHFAGSMKDGNVLIRIGEILSIEKVLDTASA